MDLDLEEFLKMPSYTVKKDPKPASPTRVPLTTKKALELLSDGKLGDKVCKFCLHIETSLYEMGQIFEIAGKKTSCKVTIRDMLGSFYPFKMTDNPDIPMRICDKCLNHTIRAYLFAQQCDRADRALHNLIGDMYEKIENLDPLEPVKKRGRQKSNPNTNILYSPHKLVKDYADFQMCLINRGNDLKKNTINQLECPKCWRDFSTIELRLNHEVVHPQSMWYCCRICGLSFPKNYSYRRHVKETHQEPTVVKNPALACKCKCGNVTDNYSEHLQHIEKHKFKAIMQNMVSGTMDKLCVVCLNNKKVMVDLNMSLRLHGGYPEITGDRTLYNILNASLPDISLMSQLTGTKICEPCLDRLIATYLLIQQSRCLKTRIYNCIDNMIKDLDSINEPKSNIFIEIAPNFIMPKIDADIFEVDTKKLKIDFLEDEYRIEESDDEKVEFKLKDKIVKQYVANKPKIKVEQVNGIDSPAKKVEDFSEFLTFHNKKKMANKRNSFNCVICNKRFISIYFLTIHVKKHKTCSVHCNKCGGRFNSKFVLQEHIKKDHKINGFTVSCADCGRTFKGESKLLQHEKLHDCSKCKFCDKRIHKSKYLEHLQRHLLKFKHSEADRPKQEVCSICEEEFSQKSELCLHINKHHLQMKPFECDMCEYAFYGENSLSSHKKIHDLPSSEKCEFCNKIIKNRRHFVVHIRRHLNTKPYSCPVCNIKFFCNSKRILHMAKHHGGKFCCKLCSLVFSAKKDLKYHRKVRHAYSFL